MFPFLTGVLAEVARFWESLRDPGIHPDRMGAARSPGPQPGDARAAVGSGRRGRQPRRASRTPRCPRSCAGRTLGRRDVCPIQRQGLAAGRAARAVLRAGIGHDRCRARPGPLGRGFDRRDPVERRCRSSCTFISRSADCCAPSWCGAAPTSVLRARLPRGPRDFRKDDYAADGPAPRDQAIPIRCWRSTLGCEPRSTCWTWRTFYVDVQRTKLSLTSRTIGRGTDSGMILSYLGIGSPGAGAKRLTRRGREASGGSRRQRLTNYCVLHNWMRDAKRAQFALEEGQMGKTVLSLVALLAAWLPDLSRRPTTSRRSARRSRTSPPGFPRQGGVAPICRTASTSWWRSWDRNARWRSCMVRGWPSWPPSSRAREWPSWASTRIGKTRSPSWPTMPRNTTSTFPLLKDAGNMIADQFGAVRTPEVFLLDADRMVRYWGRIDDQYGFQEERRGIPARGAVTPQPGRARSKSLMAGKPVTKAVVASQGCRIGARQAAGRRQRSDLFQAHRQDLQRQLRVLPSRGADRSLLADLVRRGGGLGRDDSRSGRRSAHAPLARGSEGRPLFRTTPG